MENIVQFDSRWSEFIDKLNSAPIQDFKQACDVTGISPDYFQKVIVSAIGHWRESTTTSILNGISNISLDTIPHGDIFTDIAWQTRFIIMAMNSKLLSRLDVSNILDKKNKPIQVKNEFAKTVNNIGQTTVNKIIRTLFLYWFVNNKKQVKLPKFIYRGIRAHDLYSHPTFAPIVADIWASDKTHDMKRKQVIDTLKNWICDKKLHQLLDSKLLSFTSAINIAKYFSNGEGFYLRVDPRKVEIITSEIHDEENVASRDIVSDKNEREYIIRLPVDYEFKPDDIIINDLSYFIAEQNPLSVGLFDHDDKLAKYEMDGIPIEAYFSWNSAGNGGRLLFKQTTSTDNGYNGYNWYLGRGNFKKQYGFDPLPTPSNLASIKNFVIEPRKRYGF
jgi:hypothetical protein